MSPAMCVGGSSYLERWTVKRTASRINSERRTQRIEENLRNVCAVIK
jgi:hypothetical protein